MVSSYGLFGQNSCSQQNVNNWTAVKSLEIGAVAVDPLGTDSRAGEFVAKRFGVKNWVPLSDRKEVMCGHVDHFKWFNLGSEHDWNIYMTPSSDSIGTTGMDSCTANSASFCGTFEDAKKYGNPESPWSCGNGSHNCFEAEATPPESFYENPWFSKQKQTSSLVGRNVCAYGPLVLESVHGLRPEVHPLEMLWWKESDSSNHWIMIQIQDRSDRFSRKDNFWRVGSVEPPDWVPWSRLPKTSEFRIPIEIPLSADGSAAIPPIEYRILLDPKYSTNVKLSEQPTTTIHDFVYKGNTLIRVNEAQQASFAGVVFDFCEDPGIRRLVGYIKIRTTLGSDEGDDKPSVALVHFIGKDGPSNPSLLSQMSSTPSAASLTSSQTVKVFAGKGGQRVRSVGKSSDNADGVSVSYERSSKNSTVAFDLLSKFAGLGTEESARLQSSDLVAPMTFKTADLSSEASRGLRVKVSSVPSTARATGNQKPKPQSGNHKSIQPEVWDFVALDCGAHNDVKTGCPNPKKMPKPHLRYSIFDDFCTKNIWAVCVFQDSSATNLTHSSVNFPRALEDHLIKVIATAKECDTSKKECENEEVELWNQGFRLKDTSPAGVEKYLAERASDANLPTSVIALRHAEPDSPLFSETNPQYRESQMLHLFLTHIGEDGILEPDDFMNIIAAVKRLGGFPNP